MQVCGKKKANTSNFLLPSSSVNKKSVLQKVMMDCISLVSVAARLVHRIIYEGCVTYTWRVVEVFCVLLILLVKSFVLQEKHKHTGLSAFEDVKEQL